MLLDNNLLHRSDCCNGQGGVAAALHWAVCHYCRCFPSQTTFIYNTPVNTHKSCVILRRPNHTHTHKHVCAVYVYRATPVIYNKNWLFRVCRKSKCGIFPLAPSFVLRLWHLPTNFVARNRAGRPCTKVLDKTLSHSTHTHTHTPTKSRPTDGAAACV